LHGTHQALVNSQISTRTVTKSLPLLFDRSGRPTPHPSTHSHKPCILLKLQRGSKKKNAKRSHHSLFYQTLPWISSHIPSCGYTNKKVFMDPRPSNIHPLVYLSASPAINSSLHQWRRKAFCYYIPQATGDRQPKCRMSSNCQFH